MPPEPSLLQAVQRQNLSIKIPTPDIFCHLEKCAGVETAFKKPKQIKSLFRLKFEVEI